MAGLYGADPGKVRLAPCGVDLAKFRPMDQGEVRRKLGLNGEKVLLYVGRVEPLKGLDLLVETAAQIEAGDEKVRMMVVGGGGPGEPETDRVRRLAEERRVNDLIDFVGRLITTNCPCTTMPPTCVWYPPTTRVSGWWRWSPWPAAPPSWRREWAGCLRWYITGIRGISSLGDAPRPLPIPSK